MDAYGVPDYKLTGGPQWVNSDRWDLEAQSDGPKIMSPDQYRQMLVSLLEDRFRLRAHRETKVIPIYELTMASTGSEMTADPFLDARGSVIREEVGSIQLRNSSLEMFAKLLSVHLGRPVVDKTGMAGLFRLSLDWAPVPGEDERLMEAGFGRIAHLPATNTNAASIFQGIQEQLGLRLTPHRGPIEVVVIDKAQRPRRH